MTTIDKNKFIDLKRFIKEEPGTGPRLQSLKKPRDLNLGLPKQPKKKFVPNLNATRNKDKPKEFNKRDEKGKERTRDRKQNKNNAPKFVQSSGVFSEGIGGEVARNRHWSGVRAEKDGESTPAITMPTIKKNSFQVDKKNEDSVLNKITGCDDDSDDEKLPFKPISWHNRLPKPSLMKKEIKTELPDDEVTPNLIKKLKIENGAYNIPVITPIEYLEDGKFDDTPSLSLWRLPDSFAGKGLSDDPNCKEIFDYCLSDMHEGQIGKIVLRKSGRMEVHIGHTKYDLEPGETEFYKEDIVSVNSSEQNKKTNAAILGNIKNRYFLSPDWDRLLL